MHTPRDRYFVAVVTALLLGTVPTLAQRVNDVERRYQAALHAEQVEGNLTVALKAYEGLAAVTNGPTEIRLKALVRQAGIHDALGLASDDLYQRVVREFPTRPEADAAQRKLAARRAAALAASPAQTLTVAGPSAAVFVAQLDSADRIRAWEPRVLDGAIVWSFVQWAPDNRQVVYVAGSTARVQDVTDAKDRGREVYRGAASLTACVWARTRPRVYCGERKAGDTELVAIDVATLSVERLGTFGGVRYPLQISSDDRVLSFNKDTATGLPKGTGGISWVIGTDPSTESALSRTFATGRSEDGNWVLDIPNDRILPASGEGPGVPLERNVPPTPGFLPASIRFTADSRWVIFRGRDAEGKDGLYRSSMGGPKERLGDHPPVAPGARAWMVVSEDGRHFLAVVDQVTTQQK